MCLDNICLVIAIQANMKNLSKVPLTLFWATILLFQASASLACSCIYGGEFAKNSRFYDGVVRAKVIEYGQRHRGEAVYKSMIVEVTDVIKGTFNHTELELMGDLGYQCREYVDSRKFGIGKEFLFVIRNEEAVQELAGCGESSILVDGDTINGYKLTGDGYKPYSMSLDAMIEKMKVEAIKYEKLQQDSSNLR